MTTPLSHLTLNTGHLARTGRSDVAGAMIDRLLPVIDAQGGPVPGLPDWHLDFLKPLKQAGIWRAPPAEPPPVPWLAVWLTPFAVLADAQAAQAFGDMERCVAFALMDT